MKPRDAKAAHLLRERLAQFEIDHGLLPGIEDEASRESFIAQLLESMRRIEFIHLVRNRPISPLRMVAYSGVYDPIRAAIAFHASGDVDEAFWQIFLFVHFGKHVTDGWRLAEDVYGKLGASDKWGWIEVSASPISFRTWLDENKEVLRGSDGLTRRFGNHRKYLSLDAWSNAGTGAAVQTYVEWVTLSGGHQALVDDAFAQSFGDPRETFDALYKGMEAVASFGRIARFDYLTMIGKLGFASIEPGSPYMAGATGPFTGARMLLGRGLGNRNAYDVALIALGHALGVGMQVMEDAVCNWQKSPDKFIAFRG